MKITVVPPATHLGTLTDPLGPSYPNARDKNPNVGSTDSGAPAPLDQSSGVPKASAESGSSERRFATIRMLAAQYRVSKSTIYNHIKTDPTFPYRNVGIRKKFVVDVLEFEKWSAKRTDHERHLDFNIPTGADLLRRLKK